MRKRSEAQLEELLRGLPKINDERHPNEIYQNITLRSRKNRLPSWLLPGAAVAAVGCLLFILSPMLTNLQNSADKGERTELSTEEHSALVEKDTLQKSDANDPVENTRLADEQKPERENEDALTIEEPSIEPSSVYSSDLEHFEAITYPIPDRNAQIVVPVTVLVDKNESKQWFQQFEDTMPKLIEEEWGLAEYYPLNAAFDYDQGKRIVNINLPADHQYGLGSASETIFLAALKRLFPMEFVEKLTFTTEGKSGITLGNYGELTELENQGVNQQAYFFYYDGESDRPYIVPAEDAFESIEEAFSEMSKDRAHLGLKASLPKEVIFDLPDEEPGDKTLNLTLANAEELDENFMYSLEAITLTAKTFGYTSVRFEDAGIDKIGPFNLSEEIHVPVAPNKKILNK